VSQSRLLHLVWFLLKARHVLRQSPRCRYRSLVSECTDGNIIESSAPRGLIARSPKVADIAPRHSANLLCCGTVCRSLVCGEGPQRGRFAMTHMNNWQHASVYPAFLLAGALDWVAMVVPLPPGMQQVRQQTEDERCPYSRDGFRLDWVALAVRPPPGVQQVRRGRGRSALVDDRQRAHSARQRQRQQEGEAERHHGLLERVLLHRCPARLDGLGSQAVRHALWQPRPVMPGLRLCQLPQTSTELLLLQVALAFAFYIEGFLMENHRKHEPLDQTVHTLLVRWPFLVPVDSTTSSQYLVATG
jgi:hypothetical protein